jgi:hypothetical protein
MRAPVVCVHRLNGRPVCFRPGVDRVVAVKKGPVVIVFKDGERVEVRESRKEIEQFIRDA